MLNFRSYLSAFLISTMLLSSLGLLTPTWALWPFGDDDPEQRPPVTEPPPANWKEENCEPIRQKAIELNQTMASWNLIRGIRVSRLKRKHRKCIRVFEDQEYDYLKQAELGRR